MALSGWDLPGSHAQHPDPTVKISQDGKLRDDQFQCRYQTLQIPPSIPGHPSKCHASSLGSGSPCVHAAHQRQQLDSVRHRSELVFEILLQSSFWLSNIWLGVVFSRSKPQHHSIPPQLHAEPRVSTIQCPSFIISKLALVKASTNMSKKGSLTFLCWDSREWQHTQVPVSLDSRASVEVSRRQRQTSLTRTWCGCVQLSDLQNHNSHMLLLRTLLSLALEVSLPKPSHCSSYGLVPETSESGKKVILSLTIPAAEGNFADVCIV